MDLQQLQQHNTQSMARGRHRREQQLQRWRTQTDLGGGSADWERLAAEIEQAHGEFVRRQQALPSFELDTTLPIAEHAEQIRDCVRTHSVTVVTGETGSGKSTQLPLLLLQAGLGIDGWIGHTQPRRIAARSIARRVASQLGSPLGVHAGYQVRFEEALQESAYIKLMTDGILLAESHQDRFLNQYSALIVDEAHERSLNIDLLLGILVQLVPRRPELRVVITSATIDAAKFAEHFSRIQTHVPIVEVSGRGYPVEIRYRSPRDAGSAPRDDMTSDAGSSGVMLEAVREVFAEGPGDVLIFQPTEYDIRSLARRLRGWLLASGAAHTEIVPLYARLTSEQQNVVFAPHRGRRIVIATNVAESSLTVPGIRYVIDSGTARISRYAPRSKVQRLPIEAISQASADQRAGRCGRVGPGICIRLYDQADYDGRPRFTTPEIRRANLASVILQTATLGLGEIEAFPFLDPPTREAIRDGYDTLFEIHAMEEDRRLTELGRRLARFPTDPRIARILLAAGERGCLHEVAIIAAGLEIQDPRLRPVERQQAADEKHAQWRDPRSDFLALLRVFDFYHHLKEKLSRSQLLRACQENFLSLTLLRQWSDVHRQLLELSREQRLRVNSRRDDDDAIHQALLTGFLSGVAQRSEGGQYQGARQLNFHLWPGSGLMGKPPPWIMVAELVETSRRYGRTAAAIQPTWIEPLAGHLLEHHFSDPHWSDKSQRCVAAERITLYGLTVDSKRQVPYGEHDPVLARELLIQEGLIAGRVRTRARFFAANQALRTQAAEWATKTRDRRWITDDWTLARFYHERLPPEVLDTAGLEKRLQQDPALNERLTMTWEDLIGAAPVPAADAFPSRLDVGPTQLPLRYRLAPGAEDDGISVEVPRPALGQLVQSQLDWLVPGRLTDLIAELIRGLPKGLRRTLIPAQETAAKAASRLRFGDGVFLSALARELTTLSGERIRPENFRWDQLPPEFRFHLSVRDESGQVLAAGRDLQELKRSLGVGSAEPLAAAMLPSGSSPWQRDALTRWDFGDLPPSVIVERSGTRLTLYPTIVDAQETVGLRLVESPALADWHRRFGLARLRRARRASRDPQSCPLASRLDRQRARRQSVDCLGGVGTDSERRVGGDGDAAAGGDTDASRIRNSAPVPHRRGTHGGRTSTRGLAAASLRRNSARSACCSNQMSPPVSPRSLPRFGCSSSG